MSVNYEPGLCAMKLTVLYTASDIQMDFVRFFNVLGVAEFLIRSDFLFAKLFPTINTHEISFHIPNSVLVFPLSLVLYECMTLSLIRSRLALKKDRRLQIFDAEKCQKL